MSNIYGGADTVKSCLSIHVVCNVTKSTCNTACETLCGDTCGCPIRTIAGCTAFSGADCETRVGTGCILQTGDCYDSIALC